MTTHIIIGGGQAGACAAIAMRKVGFAGRVVLVGREPGVPYEKPPLSKTVLAGDVSAMPPAIYSPATYADLSIETYFGVAVVDADPDRQIVALSSGQIIPYTRVLLATGGEARRLSLPGSEHIAALRTVSDAIAIRRHLEPGKHIVCIGGGVIGLEVAAVARAKGCDVTVVELGSSVMARALCPELQRYMTTVHRKNGVVFHFGRAPVSVKRLESGRDRLLLTDGTTLDADIIVAGVGLERNVEIARKFGIEIDNGIMVDEFGQTSRSEIYAAGDVAAFWHPLVQKRLRLESWKHAQNHGIAVGQNMAGAGTPYQDIPWFWSDQYDLTLQIAGLPQDAQDSVIRAGDRPGSLVSYHLRSDGVVVGVTTINEPRAGRAAQALIKSKSTLPPELYANPQKQANVSQ